MELLIYSVIMLQCFAYTGDPTFNAPRKENIVYEGCNVNGWCTDTICDWYTYKEDGYPNCWYGKVTKQPTETKQPKLE